jgi:hypothetical protein
MIPKAQGRAFRLQPIGLCLQGRPHEPQVCSFQQSGPGSTPTFLRLRPSGSPLRFKLSSSRVNRGFMDIHFKKKGRGAHPALF